MKCFWWEAEGRGLRIFCMCIGHTYFGANLGL